MKTYEPMSGYDGTVWLWFANAGVSTDPSDLPPALFDALPNPTDDAFRAYPTREDAMRALADARDAAAIARFARTVFGNG